MESSSESSEPFTIRELRIFTMTCMAGYSDAAVAKMLEAEELLCRGLALREEALALFARANQLALEYAKAKEQAVQVQVPDQDEDIPW